MTTRRAFIGALAGGLLAVPFPAEAQLAAKIARIGYVSGDMAMASHMLAPVPTSLGTFPSY